MLTPEQTARYKRHLLLPEIGGQGQQALLGASVLVVGAGALGCGMLPYLAAAGIGRIGICDGDKVEISNLQRQVLYRTGDIGRPKASCAAERLSTLNPDVRIEAQDCFVTAENAEALLAPYDLIVEGLDRYAPRYVLNSACLSLGKPLLSAAIGRFDGQIALFRPGRGEAPCYACLVPEAPDDEAACEAEGVLGAVPGIVGTMAAAEAIGWICGLGEPGKGWLILHDTLRASTRRIVLPRDPACPVCAGA